MILSFVLRKVFSIASLRSNCHAEFELSSAFLWKKVGFLRPAPLLDSFGRLTGGGLPDEAKATS
jgi:hypothetical protein